MNARKTGTREWSEHSVNCCVGCSHDCLYCYARLQARRFGQIKTAADWRREQPVAPAIIRQPQNYHGRYKGVVMFPTRHDLTPGNRESCMAVLKKLLAAGNQVLLVTKPHLEIMPEVAGVARAYPNGPWETGYRHFEVRCSITCLDDDVRRQWEPGAPDIQERIEALRYLHAEGIPTSVSIEPNLQPDRVHRLVEIINPYVSGTIWIGKLNQMQARLKWAFDGTHGLPAEDQAALADAAKALRLQQSDEAVMSVVQRLKAHPLVRWKDSYQEVIERNGGK
jgi:DNA repair photolyase